MWPPGEEPRRYEWQAGTLIVPPNAWFHHHPARRRAISPSSTRRRATPRACRRRGSRRGSAAPRSTTPIESPAIRRMFTEALARQGVKSGMDDVYAAELQNLPPKAA